MVWPYCAVGIDVYNNSNPIRNKTLVTIIFSGKLLNKEKTYCHVHGE